MRIRACAFAFAVAFALSSAIASIAAAQGAAPDPITEMARQRFVEGVKLFDQHRCEEARASFLQAYALKKHPSVLLNLAQSELCATHHVEAARHFAQYLRENPENNDQRKTAEQKLAEARTKTARVLIDVSPAGADIFVDDEMVGKAPLPEAIDVHPGTRKIEARFPGAAGATATVNAPIGQIANVSLKPGQAQVGAISAPPVVASPTSTSEAPAATAPTSAPVTGAPPTADQGVAPPSGGRPKFLTWMREDKVAWVTGGVALVGLTLGIAFTVATSSASSNVDSIETAIKVKAASDPALASYQAPGQSQRFNRMGNPCADPVPVTSVDYNSACSQLKDNMDKRDADRTAAIVGYSLFGVGAGATVAAYFLRTHPGDATGSAGPVVVPVVSRGMTGLMIGSSF